MNIQSWKEIEMFNKLFAAVAIMAAGMFNNKFNIQNDQPNHGSIFNAGLSGTVPDYGSGICYPMIERARRKFHRGKMYRRYGDAWRKRKH